MKDLGLVTPKTTVVWDIGWGRRENLGRFLPGGWLRNYNPAMVLPDIGNPQHAHQYARSLALDSKYAWVGLDYEPGDHAVFLNPSDCAPIKLPTPAYLGNVFPSQTPR